METDVFIGKNSIALRFVSCTVRELVYASPLCY